MELIDKSALVSEIERMLQKEYPCDNSEQGTGYDCALYELQDFLNTLEVKEVDLELNSFDATVCKIGNSYLKEMDKNAIVKALEPYKDGDKVKVIIKAQKGD